MTGERLALPDSEAVVLLFSVVEASHRVPEAASDGGVPHICRYASTSRSILAQRIFPTACVCCR